MDGTGAGGGGIIQRYKFGWRFLCISNLALGAYIFSRTPKKEKTVAENKNETKDPAEPVVEKSTPPKEAIMGSPPIPKSVIERQPVIVHEQHRAEREPISAYQQREVFKWMLEEKMKTKPNNREEKERIDEEKALLEQYIHTLGFSAHMFEPKIDKTVVASKLETKSLTEGEPVIEQQPVTKHKPLIEGEPVTKHKPVIDGEPMTEHEPFIQHESLTQHTPVMQHESVIQREPITEDEPVTERDLVKKRVPVTESEPVIQHKSVYTKERKNCSNEQS